MQERGVAVGGFEIVSQQDSGWEKKSDALRGYAGIRFDRRRADSSRQHSTRSTYANRQA